MVVVVVIVYCFICYFEWKPLLKNGDKKGFAVHLGLTVISFTLAILLSLDIHVPSPVKPITDLITSLFGSNQ